MNKIDFLDLFAINQRQHKELVSAFSRVLDSGWYIMGEELEQFEKEFAEYCGVKYCIGVANGLDALILVLRAWKELGYLEDGDEVLVPANTYIASILAITENKLVPVLVEPDIETYNINPALIENYITEKTKAILPVHLYGLLCKKSLTIYFSQIRILAFLAMLLKNLRVHLRKIIKKVKMLLVLLLFLKTIVQIICIRQSA